MNYYSITFRISYLLLKFIRKSKVKDIPTFFLASRIYDVLQAESNLEWASFKCPPDTAM